MDKKEKWSNLLAEARAALLETLNSLTPEQWEQVVFGEGDQWTVGTIVGHLVDSERGMSIHIYKIRKGEETLPEGFDLTRWNAGVKQRVGELTEAELLAGLEATRARTLQGLNTLEESDWERSGTHPSRGVITVEQYYETIAGHERMHLIHIQEALGMAR
ncbi:MAG: DinB family protein [Caldilineaceae bacterium]|nr:DinB family protein [Caldilineaceae bacterium]HRJ43787.1 DinB family protein [Caldilineaceae bacterium]